MLRYLGGMTFICGATLYTWLTRSLKGEKPSLREIWKENTKEEPFS